MINGASTGDDGRVEVPSADGAGGMGVGARGVRDASCAIFVGHGFLKSYVGKLSEMICRMWVALCPMTVVLNIAVPFSRSDVKSVR